MLVVMVKKETAKVQRQVGDGEKPTIIGWGPLDSNEDKMRKGQDIHVSSSVVL